MTRFLTLQLPLGSESLEDAFLRYLYLFKIWKFLFRNPGECTGSSGTLLTPVLFLLQLRRLKCPPQRTSRLNNRKPGSPRNTVSSRQEHSQTKW